MALIDLLCSLRGGTVHCYLYWTVATTSSLHLISQTTAMIHSYSTVHIPHRTWIKSLTPWEARIHGNISSRAFAASRRCVSLLVPIFPENTKGQAPER